MNEENGQNGLRVRVGRLDVHKKHSQAFNFGLEVVVCVEHLLLLVPVILMSPKIKCFQESVRVKSVTKVGFLEGLDYDDSRDARLEIFDDVIVKRDGNLSDFDIVGDLLGAFCVPNS